MSTLKQIIMVVALVLAPVVAASAANAATTTGWTCQDGFELTGPGSDNLCVKEEITTCEVDSDNTVVIGNTNVQVSETGDGGYTGNASNENGFTLNVEITSDEVCTITTTVPATPPAEEEKEVVPAPEKEAAPVLATTSGNSTPMIVAAVLGAAAVGLAAVKLAGAYISRR